MNFSNIRIRMRSQRWALLNCSALVSSPCKKRAGLGELGFDFVALGVAEIDVDSRLPGVACLAGDSAKEFGAGGYCLAVPLAVDKAGVEAPPVVDLGDESGGDLAAVEVLCGEPGPTPLVFEFVKGVFGIAALPVRATSAGAL